MTIQADEQVMWDWTTGLPVRQVEEEGKVSSTPFFLWCKHFSADSHRKASEIRVVASHTIFLHLPALICTASKRSRMAGFRLSLTSHGQLEQLVLASCHLSSSPKLIVPISGLASLNVRKKCTARYQTTMLFSKNNNQPFKL